MSRTDPRKLPSAAVARAARDALSVAAKAMFDALGAGQDSPSYLAAIRSAIAAAGAVLTTQIAHIDAVQANGHLSDEGLTAVLLSYHPVLLELATVLTWQDDCAAEFQKELN